MSRSAHEWTARPRLQDDEFVSSTVYTHPGIFELEQERIKRATWKFACHESELPTRFDFRTVEHAGYPIVLVRTEEGGIRAFINSCSHRAATVVRAPRGNAEQWRCLFHAWTYDTRGRCIAMPRASGYEQAGLCKDGMGLREVKVGIKLGMIFINLNDEGSPFDEYFGDAFEILEDVMGTKELEVFHLHKTVINANWKQWFETNMEIYHEYLHFLNRNIAMSNDEFYERRWKIYPNCHGTLTPMKQRYERVKGLGRRDERTLPGLTPGEFRVVDLFPDTTILCRATVLRIDTSNAISPNQTLVEQRGLGIKGESAEDRLIRINHHNQFWGPFGRNLPEDVVAVEAVEKSNRCGASRYGIMARHDEMKSLDDALMRAFYKEWSEYMGRPASNPLGALPGETNAANR
ncbi:MAG: aromatic ring-hydroxylating dioxygenase subunit alpha [Betaproteobacteria bacterium]|nr:MAG: aromatic ring-hydroxylating dioxygenase subunit alpha [Betaproteobacteria bacterium]